MKHYPEEIITFWFQEITTEEKFQRSDLLDKLITEKYSALLEMAKRGELYSWRVSSLGRLAEIILLDQFSRHIYREKAEAFAADSLALILAQEMVGVLHDLKLSTEQRGFAYLPYMHSESALIHQEALRLFALPGLEENFKFEVLHKEIIDRFGRYPHRNLSLGRVSTPEEVEFLKTHSGF